MKRLLATLAAMIAGGALASTTITTNTVFNGSTDFDSFAFGELTTKAKETVKGEEKFFWNSADDFTIGTVTNKENEASDNYLSVESNGDVILRRLVGGNTDEPEAVLIEDEGYNSIHFDAEVTFTASDASPVLAAEDKLVIWMKEDTSGETPTTNIVITSGVLNGSTFAVMSSNEFVAVSNCNAEATYRLTVKAYNDIGVDETEGEWHVAVPGFKVEIDGSPVNNSSYNGYFASLVNYSATNGRTLKGLAFSGTGAIDNIQMASVTETIVPEVTDFTFAVTVTDEKSVNQGVAIHYGEVEEAYEADYTKALPVGYNESVEIVITAVDATVTYVVGAGEAQSAEYDEEEGTFTFTVPAEAFAGVGVGDRLEVAITVTADEEPPTPSDTHTIEPATESLDENGTLPVEAGTTTIKIGDYNVTEAFEFNEAHTAATLKPLVVADSAEAAGDAFVIDDENDEVTINVNPVEGLYYGVSAETDLGNLERPDELTQYTGSNKAAIFTVTKPEGTAAFFKVYVDIKE